MAALAFSACTEELNNDKINGGKTVTVHFGTENTDPSTKATLTPNEGETAFQAAWENGDVLSVEYISPTTATNKIIPATWDAENKMFSAELPNETGAWDFSACYPVPNASDNSVDFGPARTQKGNAYNSKYDIMIGTKSTTNSAPGKDDDGSDIVFPMTRQTAIAYFHFTSDLDETITSATLTVSGDGAAIASNYAYVSDFAWAPTEDCQSITLTFPEDAPNAQDFKLWFNVLPTIYESMSLTIETATKTLSISKNSIGEYVAGKLYKVKKGVSWTDKGSEPGKTYAYKKISSQSELTDGSYLIVNDDYSFAVAGSKTATNMIKGGAGTAVDIVGDVIAYSADLALDAFEINSVEGGFSIKGSKCGYIGYSSDSNNGLQGSSTTVYVNTISVSAGVATVTTKNSASTTYTLCCNPNSGTPLVKYYKTVTDTYKGLSLYKYQLVDGSSLPTTYTISMDSVIGGTISASVTSAEEGTEITLTAIPDKGYAFNDDWTVTNAETSEAITVTAGKFAMPAANVNVTASFKQLSYAITANPAENGTYTVKVGEEEVTSAVYGAKVLLKATPAEGYICDGWTVVDAESNPVYVSNNSFTMPASAVTISTSFSLKPEDITYDHAGTAEDPYSVADVLKYISTLGTATSESEVYAKGVISSITEVSTKFGNATYKIKDEGVENEVLVYRGLYLEGAKFTSDSQISVGDEVVVKGKVKNYNGTMEFDADNSLVSIVKAPYLNVTASKESGIAAAGETVTITVDTNADSWSAASSDNDNFALGTPSENTVKVTVAKNTGEERTAKITITAGTLSKEITLTQKADGSTGGEVKTYQHVFMEKPSTGDNVNLSGVNWNIDATSLNGYNSQNYAGVQIGSKSANGQITLTSPSAWSYTQDGVTVTKIKEVRLWLNLGGTSVTPSVTIGGKDATSDGTKVTKNSTAGTDWTKATKVTFTPAADSNTGVIVIDVTSVKAGYICAIEIDAE